MSDYVYESGLSTKRRRQRRTAITLVLTLVLLFSAFWWAWSYIRDGESGATASPTSTGANGACADTKDVTINVFNSTGRAGLARTAADSLQAAGFTIGRVANDPEDKDLPGNVEVRYGPEGQPYAVTFGEHYGQRVSLWPDEREGTSLDVALGDGFTGWDAFPETPAC